jgi:hypothetical protein
MRALAAHARVRAGPPLASQFREQRCDTPAPASFTAPECSCRRGLWAGAAVCHGCSSAGVLCGVMDGCERDCDGGAGRVLYVLAALVMNMRECGTRCVLQCMCCASHWVCCRVAGCVCTCVAPSGVVGHCGCLRTAASAPHAALASPAACVCVCVRARVCGFSGVWCCAPPAVGVPFGPAHCGTSERAPCAVARWRTAAAAVKGLPRLWLWCRAGTQCCGIGPALLISLRPR